MLRATEQVSVIMNRFPYANGNLMVAPRCHTSEFAAMGPENSASLADELRRTVGILERVYAPQGFNIGMNLGRVADAGVADQAGSGAGAKQGGQLGGFMEMGGVLGEAVIEGQNGFLAVAGGRVFDQRLQVAAHRRHAPVIVLDAVAAGGGIGRQ